MDAFADWVRSEFGLGDGPVEWRVGGRGAVGEIWRLTVGDRAFAVKCPFGAVDLDDVRSEAALLDHLAAQGIEVPTHVTSTHGQLVVDVPAGLGGGSARVSHWIDGTPVGERAAELADEVGTLLALLHRAAPAADGPPTGWHATMVPGDDWADLVGRSVGQPWHDALVAREGEHAAYRELVDRAGPGTGPFVVGHRDLHPDNALVAPDGGLRALDWEDAGAVSPTRELAKVLVQWHVLGDAVDEAAVARTAAAYREAGGPGQLTAVEDFAMVLCNETNFLARQVRLALDRTAPAPRREQAQGEVAESLAGHLPGIAALERVLVAARSH